MSSPFPRHILAPYLASPHNVVDAMLELAAVSSGDAVYDLGCGDGRVVIAAAQRCGAHGVGVDYEAYWIDQARVQAEHAGVSAAVRFVQADALSVPLDDANVVFLYLVDWSTRRMVEHLREHCRPGTRVVSHSFSFGDGVESIHRSVVDEHGQARHLHLWRIPPL